MTDATRVVTFDIETRRLAAEIGGWDALRAGKGGISVAAVWDSITGRIHLYDDRTAGQLAEHLESADVVQSFNGKAFDVPVIEGIVGRRLIIPIHLDLLDLIWKALSQRGERRKGNTLNEVAARTLGESKPLSGVLAPQLADEGRWAELFDYCVGDVDLTKRLFEFTLDNGGVVGGDGEILTLDLPLWYYDNKE